MITIKSKLNIDMFSVPGKSSKNAAQLWKLEVNSFIGSKVMTKKLKMASFWLFMANFQCKMNKTLKRVAHQIITSEPSISFVLVIYRGICSSYYLSSSIKIVYLNVEFPNEYITLILKNNWKNVKKSNFDPLLLILLHHITLFRP